MNRRLCALLSSAILLLTFFSPGMAQFPPGEIPYNEGIIINPPVDTSRAASVDRFNNIIRPAGTRAKSIQNPLQGLPPSALTPAGPFTLVFRDVSNNTGIGFDDPGPTTCAGATDLGDARRQTACAVFNYIASVIDIPATANPIIVFDISGNTGTGPLATGSPIFPAFPFTQNYIGGYLRDHIVNGVDPSVPDEDAIITIDFAPHVVLGGTVSIYDCPDCMPIGFGVDLYSIILHEATHGMGFLSLIDANGNSVLNPTQSANTGPWSLMDDHYQEMNPVPTDLIDASNVFVAALVGSLTSNSVIYNGPGNSAPQPVFSPLFFNSGSSISHFDHTRPPNQNYVMRATTSGGVDRRWTQQELEVLVDLGYSLAAPLNSANRPPVGVPDQVSTTMGTQVCIDVLANDTDADGDALSLYANCGMNCQTAGGPPAQIIVGGGVGSSLTVNGGQICYTPPPNFAGQALIKYCPTDGQTSDVLANINNCTYLTVNVTSTFCPGDPCNLVCNGSFEEGADPFDLNVTFNFGSFNNCPSRVNNWCATSGTADYFAAGPCAFNSAAPLSFSIPLNFFNGNVTSGVDVYNPVNQNGSPNNRYVGFYTNNLGNTVEGIFAPLNQTLTPGVQYRLDFRVFGVRRNPTYPGNATVVFGLNDGAPLTGSTPANFNSTQQFSHQMTAYNWPITPANSTGGWEHVTRLITPQPGQNIDHIIFEGEVTTASPPNPLNQNYIYIDDVVLSRVQDTLLITKSVIGNTTVRPGDIVTFELELCNPAVSTNPLSGFTLEDLVPQGMTLLPGGPFSTVAPHTWAFPGTLQIGACTTLTYQAQVDQNAPFNTPITNCINIVNGPTNCVNLINGNNCATVEIPGTDVSFSKTVLPGTTPPYSNGDIVNYQIVVCNNGPLDAHDIIATDLLPNGLTYAGHFWTGSTNGTYNVGSGQIQIGSLAVGDCDTLTIRAEVTTTTCSRIDNCVSLVSLLETDMNTSNNNSCVGIDIVTVGAPALPVLIDGIKNSEGNAIVEDGNGNLYLTGFFDPMVFFPGFPTFSSAGGTDIFVAKYHPNCGFEWVRIFGSTKADQGHDIMMDKNGDIIVTGFFNGTVSFDAFTLVNSLANSDMFLLRMSPGGTVLDAAQSEAVSGAPKYFNRGYHLALDPVTGQVLVSGIFSGTTSFGGTSITSNGGTDVFVANYKNTGTFALDWVEGVGSGTNDRSGGLGIHSNGGRVYAGISYTDGFVFNSTTLSIGGSSDAAILLYDNQPGQGIPAGQWQIGGNDADFISDVEVRNNDVYATGYFSGSITTGLPQPFTSVGGSDMWIGQFDLSLFGVNWAYRNGKSGDERGLAVTTTPSGDVWFTGDFTSSASTFPGFTPTNLISGAKTTSFYGRILSGNIPDFVIMAGGNNNQDDNLTPNDICMDGSGWCFTTGKMTGTATFGTAGTISDPNPSFNPFIARLDPTGTFARMVSNTAPVSNVLDGPQIKLYPNPSDGDATLEIENAAQTAWELEVMDLNGRIIQHHTLPASNSHAIRLDLHEVPRGVYFVRLHGNDGTSRSLKLLLK